MELEETSITLDKQTIAGIFSMIEVGSCIAIKAPSQSFEFFYIMKEQAKGVTQKNISDSAQKHFVLQGETYLIGQCFCFNKSTKPMFSIKWMSM